MRTIKDKREGIKTDVCSNTSTNTHKGRCPISTERACYLSGDDKWVEIMWDMWKKKNNFLPFHRNLSPFPFAGCDWGRTQGKVMMAKGYDKIVFFNQFFTHSMWRIKENKKAVNVQESLHLFAWSPRTIHNLQLGHKVNWPYIATLPPLLLNQRKVKGLTGSSPEEQTQAASSFFIGTSPSLFSLISTFSLHCSLEHKTTNLTGSDRLWDKVLWTMLGSSPSLGGPEISVEDIQP